MTTNTIHILVTGANGGLGLGICMRLIDDFLKTRTTTERLNIIYTTRSARKGSETLKTLQAYLRGSRSTEQHDRVTFQSENVELTNLLSVRDLAKNLVASDLQKIDVIICNAGIGGWIGLDWFAAVPAVLADIRNNTTWPTYKLGTVGSITKPQLPEQLSSELEPPLGEVFCANVFGHYMLVHWLMPLLRACDMASPSKVVWVSSIEPQDHHFRSSDLQGMLTDAPYESSKRLTDVLVLTSNQPNTASALSSFTSSKSALSTQIPDAKRKDNGPPTMYVYHPGIVVTSVVALYWIIHQAYMLAIYLARWVGAPWSTVEPFNAAHGATWLALASHEEIQEAEDNVRRNVDSSSVAKQGKTKWGTAIDRFGKTTVRSTEVQNWGLTGSGVSFLNDWWGGRLARKPGAVEAKTENIQAFMAQGVEVWQQMEDLRQAWEKRLG